MLRMPGAAPLALLVLGGTVNLACMPGVRRRIICKYGLLKQKVSANMAALFANGRLDGLRSKEP